MQNKTKPDFKTGSTSFSLGLINNCNNGRYQETSARKVLTQAPGQEIEKKASTHIAYIWWVMNKTWISWGEVILTAQTWYSPKKQKLTENNASTYAGSK